MPGQGWHRRDIMNHYIIDGTNIQYTVKQYLKCLKQTANAI